MQCAERRDLILLYAAGALDAGECGGLRDHLAAGCPQCAGYLAEAEASLALLPLALEPKSPPANLKHKILERARIESVRPPMRISSWDRVVLPAAIAAVLAVAVTLLVVKQFMPANTRSPDDQKAIAMLETQLAITQSQLSDSKIQLTDAKKAIEGMKVAQLTGDTQPGAIGHVFIDTSMKNWYFFTCGMRPAPNGKTYELWLISDGQKIPAGIFDVNSNGTASLLGAVPPLKPGMPVTLVVTDEPATGPHQVPTGSLQIKGDIE